MPAPAPPGPWRPEPWVGQSLTTQGAKGWRGRKRRGRKMVQPLPSAPSGSAMNAEPPLPGRCQAGAGLPLRRLSLATPLPPSGTAPSTYSGPVSQCGLIRTAWMGRHAPQFQALLALGALRPQGAGDSCQGPAPGHTMTSGRTLAPHSASTRAGQLGPNPCPWGRPHPVPALSLQARPGGSLDSLHVPLCFPGAPRALPRPDPAPQEQPRWSRSPSEK